MGVVGEFNNNLKELEKITDTSIYSRGNSILVKSTSKKNEIKIRIERYLKIKVARFYMHKPKLKVAILDDFTKKNKFDV